LPWSIPRLDPVVVEDAEPETLDEEFADVPVEVEVLDDEPDPLDEESADVPVEVDDAPEVSSANAKPLPRPKDVSRQQP
jgi:hypothetical protein